MCVPKNGPTKLVLSENSVFRTLKFFVMGGGVQRAAAPTKIFYFRPHWGLQRAQALDLLENNGTGTNNSIGARHTCCHLSGP